jgi:restriction system protein
MDTRRIWGVRAGSFGEADHVFLDLNQIAISFAQDGGDVSSLPSTRGAFRQAVGDSLERRAHSTERPGPTQANQLFRFVHDMRIGDAVLYPRKCDRTLHWGEVTGPYLFDRDRCSDFAHRRSVLWRGKLSRDVFSQGALYEIGSVLTLFEVKTFAAEFRRKFNAAHGGVTLVTDEEELEENVARDVAETTRDFIARKLRTELKGYPLEPLVADLFCAMGYRAYATRAVRDDGIDVIAHRDELGIEPPIFKIQVKGQDANISADVVKAFYAMVHERDVGVFIATGGYTQAANDFARTKSNLKLVDGVAFIDMIQRHYEALGLKHRQQIPLKRVLVPDLANAGA